MQRLCIYCIFFMNTWMNNKFNKQEFPTGNVKQIIPQSALNFNQSLSVALVPLRSWVLAESALGNATVLVGDVGCKSAQDGRHQAGRPCQGPSSLLLYWWRPSCFGESYSCGLASATPLLLPLIWNPEALGGWLSGEDFHLRWVDGTQQLQERGCTVVTC